MDKSPPRSLKPIILTAVVSLALGGGYRWWTKSRALEKTDNATIVGTAHQISSKITGTVAEIFVHDHDHVRAGQPLIRLENQDQLTAKESARAALAQTEAQIALAKANSEKALADYNRSQELSKNRVASIAEMDAARAARDASVAALAVAEATHSLARAAMAAAELQLSYTTIRSPADGKVGAKSVQTGNRIFSGQPLMAVVEERSWIVANYKETQVAKIKPGQQVRVDVDAIPGHPFSAHVESIAPASGATFALLPPDNATGNFTKIVQRVPVRIFFDEQEANAFRDRLLPGLSVTTAVDTKSAPAMESSGRH